MGKTYEALERAEREYKENGLYFRSEPREEEGNLFSCLRGAAHEPPDCYEELKTNLLAGHPQELLKTILFSGTNHGDGSSTTAINFASTLARNDQIKVLLVEANLRTPILREIFHLKSTYGLSDLLANGVDAGSLVNPVDQGGLYVVTCGERTTSPVKLFESNRFCGFLKAMRERFDYVILDGPPIPSFSESRILCSKVDGVVMVLAAGRTREQVARKAKREIEEAGGKVLGLVLNRRKFYIPQWLYCRL